MTGGEKPQKRYSTIGPEPYQPPDYGRVLDRMSDGELRDEVAAGRGGDGYQEAARAELERRTTRVASVRKAR